MRVWHARAPAPVSGGFLAAERPLTVGRGPVPRHASGYRKLAGETRSDARVASEGPRATVLPVSSRSRGTGSFRSVGPECL